MKRQNIGEFHRPGPTLGARRRGMSVLVLGVVLVAVIATMQIAQSMFTSQVTDQAARWHHGRGAQVIAQSALAEALTQVSAAANDPRMDLYRIMRIDLPTQQHPHRMNRTPLQLPLTRESLADAWGQAYELGPVEVEIKADGPTTFVDETEYSGTILMTGYASSRLQKSAERKVVMTTGFKSVRLSCAPPIGENAVIVRNPTNLLKGRWPVNTIMQSLHGRDVPQLKVDLQKNLDSLDQAIAGLSGPNPILSFPGVTLGDLQQIRTFYADLLNGPAFPAEVQAGSRFQPYPDDPATFMLVSNGNDVDLDKINLQLRLGDAMKELKRLTDLVEVPRRSIEADFSATPPRAVPAHHADYTQALVGYINQIAVIGRTVSEVQDSFRTLNAGNPEYARLRAACYLVDPEHLLQTYSSFLSRVTYTVDEDPPQPNGDPPIVKITEKVEQLFSRLDREGRGLRGIILVNNYTQPLILTQPLIPTNNRRFHGHWTLAVRGGLELSNFKARPDDSFTILAGGIDASSVIISGEVDATVLATGRRLTIEQGARIKGALILSDLFLDSINRFEGHVVRDVPVPGAPPRESHRILVSPLSRTTIVRRSFREP